MFTSRIKRRNDEAWSQLTQPAPCTPGHPKLAADLALFCIKVLSRIVIQLLLGLCIPRQKILAQQRRDSFPTNKIIGPFLFSVEPRVWLTSNRLAPLIADDDKLHPQQSMNGPEDKMLPFFAIALTDLR